MKLSVVAAVVDSWEADAEGLEEDDGGGVNEASEGENRLEIFVEDFGVNTWREIGLGETKDESNAIEEKW